MENSTLNGFELAVTQRRIWQLQQQFHTAFYTQVHVQVEGPLDKALVFSALQKLVARYEVLRTAYRYAGDHVQYPFQVIGEEEGSPDFEYVVDESDEEGSQELYATYLGHRNDTSDKDALKLLLIRQSPVKHTLILSVPSISADLLSAVGLVKELVALCSGQDTNEEETVWPFSQYSEWNNVLLEERDPEAARFWSARTSANNPRLSFSIEQAGEQGRQFHTQPFAIDRINTGDLVAFCNEHQYDLDSFLLSAWLLLVWFFSGKADHVVLGRISNGRSLEYFSDMKGALARLVPFLGQPAATQTFDQLYQEVVKEAELLSEWQHHFDGCEPDSKRAVECGFAFEYLGLPASKGTENGISYRFEKISSVTDWFKLKLFCAHYSDSLSLELHANTKYFTNAAIGCIREQFTELIEAIITNPNALPNELFAITPRQKDLILHGFNQSVTDDVPDRLVLSRIEDQARLRPNHPALCCGDVRLSYRQMNEQANSFAQHLIEKYGVGTGQIVAIRLPRSVTQIVSMLATLKTGAAYLPLDYNVPPERLAYLLEDSEATVLILDDETLARQGFPPVIDVVKETSLFLQEAVSPRVQRTPDDLFYLMYTSGSTGKPKGVRLPDRAILNYALWFQQAAALTEADRSVLFSSLAFDLSYTSFWPALISGATVYLAEETPVFNPDRLWELMAEEKISYIKLTPSHFNLLINSERFESSVGETALRLIVLGGEAIRTEDLDYYFRFRKDTRIMNHYGPTESAVGVVAYPFNAEDFRQFKEKAVIGRPINHTQVFILDEQNELSPVGAAGELCIGGRSVSDGYHKREELTAEKFIPNPFGFGRLYKSGDLARWMPDGTIEYMGRRDFQVKISGYRIELGEIAEALMTHEKISKAFVTTGTTEGTLAAFFIASDTVTAADLKAFLARKLPEYMIPASLTAVAQFPLLPNGKIDRTNLLSMDKVSNGQEEFIAPSTETEMTIAALWQKSLQCEQVGIHDNFFDIGGNSFKLIKIFTELSKIHKGRLSLTDLFKYNTIHSLAVFLDSATAVAETDNAAIFNFEV